MGVDEALEITSQTILRGSLNANFRVWSNSTQSIKHTIPSLKYTEINLI